MVPRVRETLTIDPRFNGPPDSGNGGYPCGSVAQFVDAPAAEVTLRLPPPIGRELQIARGDGGAVTLLDGDTVIAEALPVDLPAEAPPPVDAQEATRAVDD